MTITERRLSAEMELDKAVIPLSLATRLSAGTGEICPPADTATRICAWSSAKTTLPLDRLLSLSILGGVYIGLGGALATLAMSESGLGHGPTRWLGGIAFSLGLVLVVIGGAELSTGNCLMTIARMRGVTTSLHVWRNLSWSYAANATGALLLAWLVVLSGIYDAEPLHSAAIRIAEAKLSLGVILGLSQNPPCIAFQEPSDAEPTRRFKAMGHGSRRSPGVERHDPGGQGGTDRGFAD